LAALLERPAWASRLAVLEPEPLVWLPRVRWAWLELAEALPDAAVTAVAPGLRIAAAFR